MPDTTCMKCNNSVNEEHIFYVKGRGWICETCLDAEQPYPYDWSKEEDQ